MWQRFFRPVLFSFVQKFQHVLYRGLFHHRLGACVRVREEEIERVCVFVCACVRISE